MATDKIVLYHGTDPDTAQEIGIGEASLIGRRKEQNPDFSGSLTPDLDEARYWALLRTHGGDIGLLDDLSIPGGLLVFEAPVGEVEDLGTIPGNPNTHAYCPAGHRLSPEEVSQDYLDKLGMTREQAVATVGQGGILGRIEFYEVPLAWLRGVEEIEFI